MSSSNIATTNNTTPPLERAKEFIMHRVKEKDNVSFAELEYHMKAAGLYEEDSELRWTIYANDYERNLILWSTENKLLADAYIELKRANAFNLFPTDASIYMIDGMCPNLPTFQITKRNAHKVGHLKNLHWLPVVLSTRPHPVEEKGGGE